MQSEPATATAIMRVGNRFLVRKIPTVLDRRYRSAHSHANRVARLADFFAVQNRACRIFEFAFAGRSIDRRRAKIEPNLYRRFIAFALTIKIDPGSAAAGFSEWDRNKVSGLTRAAELGFVFGSIKFPGIDSKPLANVGIELRM